MSNQASEELRRSIGKCLGIFPEEFDEYLPNHTEEVLEMVTDTNQERGLKQMSKTPLPEQKNCMFQYATSYKYISTEIYDDTDLITLSEAKALWSKYKSQFIRQLQDDTSSPQMAIWTDCNSNTDYATELYYADDDTKTDGENLWNETITRKELL